MNILEAVVEAFCNTAGFSMDTIIENLLNCDVTEVLFKEIQVIHGRVCIPNPKLMTPEHTNPCQKEFM